MSYNPENTDTIRYQGPSAVARPERAIEPWFTILVSSLVPLGGGLFMPAPWRAILQGIGGVMCVAGLVLLVRHEMIERRQRNVTEG